MFDKLKQRWKVNGVNLVLIILTFAVGGSLCGRVSSWIINYLPIDTQWVEVVLFIIFCSLTWPLCVLLVSFPLGQFSFFKKYIVKILGRLGGNVNNHPITDERVINLAIFASGAGSNAQQLITHFAQTSTVKIALVVCNKPGAGVIHIANTYKIPVQLIEKEPFFKGDHYLPVLKQYDINYIILAGFLWKIPEALVAAYPKKIINIHPALLPKYGGKGMFGHHVHEAVLANNEKESGITIHYVDEQYDHGATLFQATCPINDTDTPDTLAQKIHQLEHQHFSVVIEKLLQKQNRS